MSIFAQGECPLLAAGASQGSLGEEAGAALCQGHQTPDNSPWGTPEALSHAGGTSGKAYLRNRKHEREATVETAVGTPRSEEEEQPYGRADIPHGDSTQRKGVRGKTEKETAGL